MTRMTAFATKKNHMLILFNLLVGVTFTVIALQYALPVTPTTNHLAMAQTIGVVGLVAIVMPMVVLAEIICYAAVSRSAQMVKARRARP